MPAGAGAEPTLRLTPARLGFVDGEVSFWRPAAGDWEAAQMNLPLAAGDVLASRDGRFELQVGRAAFVRGGDDTRLRVKSQEPDFLQLEVTQGTVVLDLRDLAPGRVIGVDTPVAGLTTTRDGYYRVDVGDGSTRVTVRRAGSASVTPLGGQALSLSTGEAAVLGGPAEGQLSVAAAPAFDDWDRWNYERADAWLAAPRSSAVAADVYGAEELERHGSWRDVLPYGRVWVPFSVSTGWAPYTYGRWISDPLYGWAWVDYAPWGWAPFHYGRWIYNGYWAWAPGPALYAPVYSPALVAFFGPSLSVRIGVPFVSWVALGWGEPVIPWWGGVGYYGVPCWYGWGGPYVVNNVVINTPGNPPPAERVNLYRNAAVPGGLIGVPKHQFHGVPVQQARLAALSNSDVKPLPSAPRSDGARQAGASGSRADFSRHPAPQKLPGAPGLDAQDFTRRATGAGSGAQGAPAVSSSSKDWSGDGNPFARLRNAGPNRAGAPALRGGGEEEFRRVHQPAPFEGRTAGHDPHAAEQLRAHRRVHREPQLARRPTAQRLNEGTSPRTYEPPPLPAAVEPQPRDSAPQRLREGASSMNRDRSSWSTARPGQLGATSARPFGRDAGPGSAVTRQTVPKPMGTSNFTRSGGLGRGGAGSVRGLSR